jgi:hypothetical protein
MDIGLLPPVSGNRRRGGVVTNRPGRELASSLRNNHCSSKVATYRLDREQPGNSQPIRLASGLHSGRLATRRLGREWAGSSRPIRPGSDHLSRTGTMCHRRQPRLLLAVGGGGPALRLLPLCRC